MGLSCFTSAKRKRMLTINIFLGADPAMLILNNRNMPHCSWQINTVAARLESHQQSLEEVLHTSNTNDLEKIKRLSHLDTEDLK